MTVPTSIKVSKSWTGSTEYDKCAINQQTVKNDVEVLGKEIEVSKHVKQIPKFIFNRMTGSFKNTGLLVKPQDSEEFVRLYMYNTNWSGVIHHT